MGIHNEDELSLTDLKVWAKHQLAALNRAAELRRSDIASIVEPLERGEISNTEAMQRFHAYDNRWPEALPGVLQNQAAMTDDELRQEIDNTRKRQELRQTGRWQR